MAMPAWVSEVGVAATVTVATVAIWGERLRAAILRPRLTLRLRSDVGELTTQAERNAQGTVDRLVPARYYHLLITNGARFPAAHEVQVFLTRIETPGPDGNAQTLYRTDLPLTWMYPHLFPDPRRTIGHTTVALADLFFLRPDRLELLPVVVPYNLPSTFQPDAHFWVTVVARGIDGESNTLRLKVDWDGQWELGEAEMARHLTIAVT